MTTKNYDPDVAEWLAQLKTYLLQEQKLLEPQVSPIKPQVSPIKQQVSTNKTCGSGNDCELCQMFRDFDAEKEDFKKEDFLLDKSEIVQPEVSKPEIIEKRFVQVEARINTLADLIALAEQAKDKWDFGNPELEFSVDFAKLTTILPEMKELDAMVGLVEFKKTIVAQIVYYLQGMDRDAKGQVIDYKHMVLAGPPGVGKTEVAMIVARLFLSLGVLKNNVFKKTTRSDLVAGFLGQTAMKTAAVIQGCLGGVLFIDEAYSLGDTGSSKQDTYSREAIDTLCEAMSFHKAELMVIIAGYQQEIDAFLDANQGLESRFLWRHLLEPYSATELAAIFDKKVAEAGWSRSVEPGWMAWFHKNRDAFTGAGRDMEKLLSFMKMSHARRVFGLKRSEKLSEKGSEKRTEESRILSEEDREEGWKLFQEQRSKKAKPTTTHQFYFV
jgi:SpoVK/Ycf46/Vps4 family AAA+-type ATPase